MPNQAQRKKAKYASNQRIIQDHLKMNDTQYMTLRLQVAEAFVRMMYLKMSPLAKMSAIDKYQLHITTQKQFWSWWNNQWNMFDETYAEEINRHNSLSGYHHLFTDALDTDTHLEYQSAYKKAHVDRLKSEGLVSSYNQHIKIIPNEKANKNQERSQAKIEKSTRTNKGARSQIFALNKRPRHLYN